MGNTTHNVGNIYQLVYVSTSTIPLEIEDIQAIEKVSCRNNKALEITGLLTYCDCKFMQFLEGDQARIKLIFSRIKKDTRHHSVDVLRQGYLYKRQFNDWYMKYTSIDEIQLDEGYVYKKLFEAPLPTRIEADKAKESLALLVAFKNSCSNVVYRRRE